ncbi:MAG: hypothetical protein IMY76_07935, partial [Chloroflexi bacterium]|nr:hypothetical protein [Chloroflexota bacterium]
MTNQSYPVFVAPSGLYPTSTKKPVVVKNTQPVNTPEVSLPTVHENSMLVSTPTPAIKPTSTARPVNAGPVLYYAQAGDTLEALAVRFGVDVDDIESTEPLPERGFINPN